MALLGVICENSHLRQIFKHITTYFVGDWPKYYRDKYNSKIIECTLKLRECYPRLVKASANKYLYTFNIRHLFRILHSMACFEPQNSQVSE